MINFAAVETSVKALKAHYEAGLLDPKAFEAQLLNFVELADDGYYWMFGHDSQRWFRHDGQRWVADSPGQMPPRQNIPSQTQPDQTDPTWLDLNMGWFIASLVLIMAIGTIVYSSV